MNGNSKPDGDELFNTNPGNFQLEEVDKLADRQ